MLRKVTRLFCSIGIRASNPYMELLPSQLLPIIKIAVGEPANSINQINNLIDLLQAAQKNRMGTQSNALMSHCISGLENVNEIINDLDERDVGQLQIHSLFKAHQADPKCLNAFQVKKLEYFYENTYASLLPFSKLLETYEHTQESVDLHFVNQAC